MRRLMCVLFVLVLCILAMSAGCTGIPGMPKTTAPGSASAPVTEPTGMAGNSWTGTFMTTWMGGGHDVRMVMVQSGNSVTGTYEYGGGTISGTVQGNRLVGTWTEDKGESRGPVEFDMAQDGKTFAGWWDYEGADFEATKQEAPSWTGIRVS
jgi:MscS family membrane protein